MVADLSIEFYVLKYYTFPSPNHFLKMFLNNHIVVFYLLIGHVLLGSEPWVPYWPTVFDVQLS